MGIFTFMFRLIHCFHVHNKLAMYYIRLLLYDIVSVTARFSQGFSTKCIGCNTICISIHRI